MVVIEEFYTYCDWLLMEVGSGFEVEVVVVIKFFFFFFLVVVTGEFQRQRERERLVKGDRRESLRILF